MPILVHYCRGECEHNNQLFCIADRWRTKKVSKYTNQTSFVGHFTLLQIRMHRATILHSNDSIREVCLQFDLSFCFNWMTVGCACSMLIHNNGKKCKTPFHKGASCTGENCKPSRVANSAYLLATRMIRIVWDVNLSQTFFPLFRRYSVLPERQSAWHDSTRCCGILFSCCCLFWHVKAHYDST